MGIVESIYLVDVAHIVQLTLNTLAVVESMVCHENSYSAGAVASKIVFQPLHILG